MEESPPAIATCSSSLEKSTEKTPLERPVTVPEAEGEGGGGEEKEG